MKAIVKAVGGFALAATLAMAMSAPARAAESAVAYQENAAHTGSTTFAAGFTAPLKEAWVKDLGGAVSYPLVVGNLVFVTVSNNGNYGTQLIALNLKTGAVIWNKPISGTYYTSNLAYDKGRIFNVNEDGLLRAFTADRTGTPLWSTQLRFQYGFSHALIATGGNVYIGGSGVGGNVYAVKESTGAITWSTFLDKSADSTPAFGDKSLFVSVVCNDYRLSAATGQILWHITRGCFGGGGTAPVYYQNTVFALNGPSLKGPVELNAETGQILRSIKPSETPAIWTPAGADPLEIAANASGLQAYDLVSGNKVWSFASSSPYQTPAIVINNVVAAGAVDGTLTLLDAATGHKLWSANVGASIGPLIGGYTGPMWGLNAGSGALVVPAQTTLSAWVPQ